MGMSSMLGIVEAIGTLFGNLLTWLMNNVLSPLLQTLVGAALKSVIYSIASTLYNISRFLLALIDFVEVLFRALAGLPNDEVTIVMEGSSSTNPDLLIQMLTSQTVIDAFLSCCIVGIFLLLMTTIFQIIKVEYTTEGAQNSKSSIIGKSLKQFANLLLIPVLVIFGVFIGNTVLDLIDTATSGANKTKISGLLWTTAASDSMWKGSINGESFLPDFLTEILAAGGSLNPEMLVTIGAMWGLVEGFADGIGNWINDGDEQFKLSDSYLLGDGPEDQEYRDYVEGLFMSEDVNAECSYGNLAIVLKYYNIFSVNYLVLIFGACVIIKCLYHVCFGMIDRIYQCVALFIVSPFVIGMAPVKDSLGSWRSKFIQKALSAYGTIISMNLFFIITDLFMSIDISFMPNMTASVVLGMSLMEGLVKSLFIIVGSLMIEKLSGDLGQYFGGGNAMADGKGLADDATKGIKNVVKTGVGVAGMMAGGAGLAIKGVSMASKLAKGAGAAKKAETGVADAVTEFNEANDSFGSEKVKTEAMNRYDNHLIKKQELIGQRDDAKKKIDASDAIINDKSGKYTKAEIAKAKEDKAKALVSHNNASMELDSLQSVEDNKWFQKADRLRNAETNLTTARETKEQIDSEKRKKSEARSQHVRDNLLTGSNALVQSGRDLLGSMPGMNIVNDIKKDWDGARDKGSSASPEGKAALEREKKRKEDKAETAYNENILNKTLISETQKAQNQLITKAVIQKAEFATNDLNASLEKYANKFNAIADKLLLDAAHGGYSSKEDEEYARNEQKSILEAMQSLRGGQTVTVEGGKILEANYKIDLNIDAFKNSIEAALKKNATTDQINEIIANQIKAAGLDGNAQLLKELKKAVEEVKNSIGGK